MKLSIIIPAAGNGSRMGGDVHKQFLLLDEKPIIVHTIEKFLFLQSPIIIATQRENFSFLKKTLSQYSLPKNIQIVEGGERRQDSIFSALSFIEKNTDIVVVHDAVRPFVSSKIINEVIEQASQHSASIVAVPMKDTVKTVIENRVEKTLDRSTVWNVQTPQVFRYQLLMDSYINAQKNNISATDDSFLVEQLGISPIVVKGDYHNIKITTPEDLLIADIIHKKNFS